MRFVSHTRGFFCAAFLLCFWSAALAMVTHAQPPPQTAPMPVKPLPEGGVSLLPADALTAFKVVGATGSVEMTTVPVAGQPFTQALRLRTRRGRLANVYAVQIQATPTAPVKKDDVLLATFYVRSVEGGQPETGEAETQFVFERAGEPYTKSVEKTIQIPRGEWRRIDVPFRAAEDREAAGNHINFRLGYPPQVIEIGGISVVNYQNRVALNDLPRTPSTYAGREPGAPWRKAAQARIEKIRRGDLTVRVVDENGKAVPDAQVSVQMQRHAFPFGSAVAAEMLLGTGPDNVKYREIITKRFNRVVMENDLKWPEWERNRRRARQGVAWLRARNIEVRGHNLVWPSWRYSPQGLESLKSDPNALARRVREHIRDEAGAMRGLLVDWDVINEPFDNHDIMDVLGNDVMVEWFRLAHAADPTARLFLNDYPPLDGAATNNAHLNRFEKNLRFLQNRGAPLGGIGFQGHFGGNVIPPERVISGLDRFAKLGLPIAITEFDVNTTDEQLQADYLRDFMTAVFSHPAANQFIMWGFWEGRHWLPDAALWRRDWTIKPNGQAFLDLVFNQWWTEANGKTNDKGIYQTRGFLGDYEITVTANGKTKTVPAKLTTSGGAKLTVRLP